MPAADELEGALSESGGEEELRAGRTQMQGHLGATASFSQANDEVGGLFNV